MKKVISIVGAGGKTSLVHELAENYHSAGAAVLVTTTTHMKIEKSSDFAVRDQSERNIYYGMPGGTDLSGDVSLVRERLLKYGCCMAGLRCKEDPGKMCGLPEQAMRELASCADYVIIEADGAKHHSLKYPASYEPVIWPGTTDVIVVMGTWEVGKPVRDVVFRYELLERELGISPERPVDESLIYQLWKVYEKKLRAASFCGRIEFVRREQPLPLEQYILD